MTKIFTGVQETIGQQLQKYSPHNQITCESIPLPSFVMGISSERKKYP